jgi:tripartite-type tricarboxylate transporter receptor subunit TctC
MTSVDPSVGRAFEPLPGLLAIQHVLAGKLRALAMRADQRLPTAAEAGFADAQVMSWHAPCGPARQRPSSSKLVKEAGIKGES